MGGQPQLQPPMDALAAAAAQSAAARVYMSCLGANSAGALNNDGNLAAAAGFWPAFQGVGTSGPSGGTSDPSAGTSGPPAGPSGQNSRGRSLPRGTGGGTSAAASRANTAEPTPPVLDFGDDSDVEFHPFEDDITQPPQRESNRVRACLEYPGAPSPTEPHAEMVNQIKLGEFLSTTCAFCGHKLKSWEGKMQHCQTRAQANDECWKKCGLLERYIFSSSDSEVYHLELKERQGQMARYIQKLLNTNRKQGQRAPRVAEQVRAQYSDSHWKQFLTERGQDY